jgi:hypothetical protein
MPKPYICLIAACFFLFFLKVQAAVFKFRVDSMQSNCLMENFGKKVLVTGSVTSSIPKFSIKIYDSKNELIVNSSNELDLKFSFTTEDEETYNFCVENTHTQSLKFTFVLKSGLKAKDYSDVAEKSNIQPIEFQIRRLENIIKSMKMETTHLVKKEEKKLLIMDVISQKLIIMSVMTIVLLLLLSIFMGNYFKNFFKQKKLI